MNTDLIIFRAKHICHYVDMKVTPQSWTYMQEKKKASKDSNDIN